MIGLQCGYCQYCYLLHEDCKNLPWSLLNEEDRSSEDNLTQPLNTKHVNLPSSETKDTLWDYHIYLHKSASSCSRMIAFEHHLDFCLVGFGQSEQRMSKFCIHVFHQLVFSLLEENHLVEITFLVVFHSLSLSCQKNWDSNHLLLWDVGHLRFAMMMFLNHWCNSLQMMLL